MCARNLGWRSSLLPLRLGGAPWGRGKVTFVRAVAIKKRANPRVVSRCSRAPASSDNLGLDIYCAAVRPSQNALITGNDVWV